jgi:hypothetical protein
MDRGGPQRHWPSGELRDDLRDVSEGARDVRTGGFAKLKGETHRAKVLPPARHRTGMIHADQAKVAMLNRKLAGGMA